MEATAIIKNANHLTKKDLMRLFENDLLILKIDSYFDKHICNKLKTQILNNMDLGYYENAPRIGRIGKAFYETVNNEESRNEYFNKQSKWIAELRKCCMPYLSPIDSLRVLLDDIWPQGSTIASINGKKMFVGLVRYFTAYSSAEPHQDIIQRDACGDDISTLVRSQLAFNIYLDVPQYGGDLEIWDWVASDEDFRALQDQRENFSYALDRERISKSDISIKPNVGDLVLFNSSNVHAVAPSKGDRVSVSCFIGYCGINHPLILWS